MFDKRLTALYQGALRGDAHGILVFSSLLSHCDKTGSADIHPKVIANDTGLSVDDVWTTLHRLQQPDAQARHTAEGGRNIVLLDENRAWGWKVVDFEFYSGAKDASRREYHREYWRATRSKEALAKAALAAADQGDAVGSR